MSDCCAKPDSSNTAIWTRRGRELGAWMLPSIVLALMPKCPACVAAYIALGTGIGISMPTATYLRVSLIVVCVASLLFLAARSVRRFLARSSTRQESSMKTIAFLLTMFVSAVVSAQQIPMPTTGYAPVNGLKMYYEVHGPPSGDPVVLLHGSFMTITNNWTAPWGGPAGNWIGELAKARKVIAIEMQGHGRTADIKRDFSYENLADDVAALLDHLKIPSADLIGYSMGGGVAMQCAIRHPEKVRKVVSISAAFRLDGLVKEALDAFPQLTAETFKGSPIETEYRRLSPTPDEFPNFVKRVIAMDLKPYDFGADKLKATKAPMFFIHGDADGVRLEHIAEMFRLKGDEIFGDLRPRSASRLAILPDTTHITLMERMPDIVPMVNDFFDAKPQTQ